MITESFSQACCKAVKVTFETLYPTFKWVAVDDAPETFKALMWAANSGEPVPINGVSGDDNLYRSADYNIMFRAWHDAVHIRTGLRFTTQDEIAVAHVQYYVRNHHGPDLGLYLTRAQADEMVAWYSKYD